MGSQAKVWYEVACNNKKHGESQSHLKGKFVKVSTSTSRFEKKNKGCPICRKEGLIKPTSYNKVTNYKETKSES